MQLVHHENEIRMSGIEAHAEERHYVAIYKVEDRAVERIRLVEKEARHWQDRYKVGLDLWESKFVEAEAIARGEHTTGMLHEARSMGNWTYEMRGLLAQANRDREIVQEEWDEEHEAWEQRGAALQSELARGRDLEAMLRNDAERFSKGVSNAEKNYAQAKAGWKRRADQFLAELHTRNASPGRLKSSGWLWKSWSARGKSASCCDASAN
jgi:hypothetical protein